MYRVWDNYKNQYWKPLTNGEQLVMHQNGDLEIKDYWSFNEYFEYKNQTRFKVEKYFCNLDGVYYYEGDIVVVIDALRDNRPPCVCQIVWDKNRFAFKVMDDTIDYSHGFYPLMDSSTFGINLKLVGNANVSEEENED